MAPRLELSKLRDIQPKEYLVRFFLGAAISVGAGIISKTVGVRFGGMLLAFPAILPASLTLIQDKEGTRRADRSAIGAVLGGVGLVAFAGVGEALFGHVNWAIALATALGAWLVVSFSLYALLVVLRPDDSDRRKD